MNSDLIISELVKFAHIGIEASPATLLKNPGI